MKYAAASPNTQRLPVNQDDDFEREEGNAQGGNEQVTARERLGFGMVCGHQGEGFAAIAFPLGFADNHGQALSGVVEPEVVAHVHR